mmetsp:Transcript_25435/g.57543  ORF Transcript_25435/g.57543 Transcript_25435/m.57543 type:complete len:399 (-) Transcript_25435:3-1199(-)
MTPPPTGASVPSAWRTLFEASPILPQSRLLLWRPEVEHRTLQASGAIRGEQLLLRLQDGKELPGAGAEELKVDLGFAEAKVQGLRASGDHLCVQLSAAEPWRMPSEGPDLSSYEALELCCRRCREPLLRPRLAGEASLQALLLPSTLWQACAEVVACEECTPMGQGHLAAQPGRLLVDAQGLLVASGDLACTTQPPNGQGLVLCSCGAVLGEGPPQLGPRRGKSLCGDAFRRGRRCAASGVLLYKHRTSLYDDACSDNLFAAFTEEASVMAHLLALKQAEGQSRFVLLPNHPSGEPTVTTPIKLAAEALELRVAVPEVLVRLTASDCEEEPMLRVAKVFFRPCSCQESAKKGTQVVVPQEAFDAVCHVLEEWVQRLPISLTAAPDQWRCAYLPRPPEL